MDNLTLDWLTHNDLDLEFVTNLCIQALVGSVRAANGHQYDVNAEFQALEQVAATPRPTEHRPVSTDATA
jgi:hypothetical protein